MNKEEMREFARQEILNNVMTNLDSSLIFTYINNLEINNIKLITTNEEHKKLNGELRTELNNIKTMVNDLKNKCTELDISGITVCDIILKELK